MRENKNQIRKSKRSVDDKILKYSAIGLSILAVIVVAVYTYIKGTNNDVEEDLLNSEEIASILNNSNEFENLGDTEKVSTLIGKTVEESENNTISNNQVTSTNKIEVNNTSTTNNTRQTVSSKMTNTAKKEETNTAEENKEKVEETKEVKELKFEKPVEGNIVRDFSKDSLVYSETLKEWVTHLGIDIKADKTTVVKAAESGKIKTIKNDPRFGMTIVIEHENGFQTVYSNLLTSEFVVEGEKVEKGQSIGTVGNTAIFEIADEPHLHFEILKDSVQVDPNLYLK